MSWDIHFIDGNGEQVHLREPHGFTGGTYAVGGTTEAWLNVTYNYGKHFDFGELEGKTAADIVPLLQAGAEKLDGSKTSEDYWEPTEGNVHKAISCLIALAKLVPPESRVEIS